MSRFFAALVVRLRWPIVLAWIVAAVAVVVYLPSLQEAGQETSLLGLVPEDAAALAAERRSAELFDAPVTTQTQVVQRDPGGLSDDALERAGNRAQAADDGEFGSIKAVIPLPNAKDVVPASREDGTTIVNYVFFDPAVTGLFDQERETASFAATQFGEGDALVGITGAAAGQVAEWRAIEDGLPWVTVATILLIAIVLGIHFRSPVTPAVILVGASVAYIVSLRTRRPGWATGSA